MEKHLTLGVKFFLFCITTFFCYLLSQILISQSQSFRVTQEETLKLVSKGQEFIRTNGVNQLVVVLSANNPSIFKGTSYIGDDLYLFITDFSGNILAHGRDQSAVGNNFLETPSYDGVYVLKSLIKICNSDQGKGWVSYKRKDVTGILESKMSYTERIPNQNLCLMSSVTLKRE